MARKVFFLRVTGWRAKNKWLRDIPHPDEQGRRGRYIAEKEGNASDDQWLIYIERPD